MSSYEFFHNSFLAEHHPLREKCPNTEFFLVRIFLYSDQKKTPHLDIIHALTGKLYYQLHKLMKSFKTVLKNIKSWRQTLIKMSASQVFSFEYWRIFQISFLGEH